MDMRIRRHVDGIFAAAMPTKRAMELKEEMIQNLEDKYVDLIADGKSEDEASSIVIAGIGDVSYLLAELETTENSALWRKKEEEKARQRSAMFTSMAVMLYILSPLPLIFLSIIGLGRVATLIGLPMLFIMIAAATGLLIFNGMTKSYRSDDDDEQGYGYSQLSPDDKDHKRMRRAISSALWFLIVVAYVVISFSTGAWHISWVIFIIGGALESILSIFIK